MDRGAINETVKRKLYAESMGRCMNPDCQRELFIGDGDIIEKAHIVPYCETADNSFENLIVLCPNCHTSFDKHLLFSIEEVRNWKRIRQEECDRLFSKKFATFDDLKAEAVPLLLDNKAIYESYYLSDSKELWNKFECKVLVNNRKLKKLFANNLHLFQKHRNDAYSNQACINLFMLHVEEFETTRLDKEKIRSILFPTEINSMFGIAPVVDLMLPSTESLEELITKLNEQGNFISIGIGTDKPYIQLKEDKEAERVFLDDAPRLRQLYHNYDCFRSTGVRLESLNYALKYMKNRKVNFEFLNYNNLREVSINNTKIIFVYEYCLSETDLLQIAPKANSIIVNLHNWNGESCISKQAYSFSKKIDVTLFTMGDFYGYINGIKHKR